MTHFLGEHSRRLELVTRSAPNQVNPNEDLDLLVARGCVAPRKSGPPMAQLGLKRR